LISRKRRLMPGRCVYATRQADVGVPLYASHMTIETGDAGVPKG
jgi:hypothetical protein